MSEAKQDDRVELRPDSEGYKQVSNPKNIGAPPITPDRIPVSGRHCMRAQKIEIISDGTLEGTEVIVDGVGIRGLVRFELVAEKGYPRVTAKATMKYDHEDIDEFGDNAGKEAKDGDRAKTITADIFRRE